MGHRLPQLTLADLTRCGHVTRFHSVRTLRPQSLSEHHWMVTRMSNHLAKNIIGDSLTDSHMLQIMEYASLHDTPEILAGDQPSPLKAHMNMICEEEGIVNPLDKVEEEIAPWLTKMKLKMKEENPEFLYLVKLADIIDALLFISVEGIGEHAKKVVSILKETLDKKLEDAKENFPEYNWKYTYEMLDTLMNHEDKTKIAFENRG